jgi:hypothetical protein
VPASSTAADARPHAPAAGPAPGIVWLASYPKSGNTWTRYFLHSLVEVIEGRGEEPPDINALNALTTGIVSNRAYRQVLGKDPRNATRFEIAAARGEVQRRFADAADGAALIKTHSALLVDRGCPTINLSVTSGAVYIVRNPLDVVLSFAPHMGITVDAAIKRMATPGVETGVNDKTVYEVWGSWSEHVASWTRVQRQAIYVMRYEDMLEKPLETFGGLARHLLFQPSEEQLSRAVALPSFDVLRRQEDEKGFRERSQKAERFFREGRAGQWRSALSEAQVGAIVGAHEAQMRRFGYWPPPPPAA